MHGCDKTMRSFSSVSICLFEAIWRFFRYVYVRMCNVCKHANACIVCMFCMGCIVCMNALV